MEATETDHSEKSLLSKHKNLSSEYSMGVGMEAERQRDREKEIDRETEYRMLYLIYRV